MKYEACLSLETHVNIIPERGILRLSHPGEATVVLWAAMLWANKTHKK